MLFIFGTWMAYSQENHDSIEIKQKLGKVYLQNGHVLSSNELSCILEKDENAAKELKKAKANLAPIFLFSFSGGALIGWPLGTALGGGNPQWWMVAAGAGLVFCAIPFQAGYNKHVFKAVTIYNSSLKKIGVNKKIMQFGLLKTGIGIEIIF